MKKILVTASAALFATLAIAATTVPASAGGGGGNFHVTIGLGGWGPGWGPGYGYGYGYTPGIYVTNSWAAHVDWCFDHKGPSYNPDNNTYVSPSGKIKYCHSPFA